MESAEINRGDIFMVNLDPVIGSDTGKTRPAVIISNNINNKYSDTVTVIPLTTSTGKIYPFEVLFSAGTGGLEKDSKAKTNQIRTLDKRRIKNKLGSLAANELLLIEKALLIHLAIKSQ